MSRPNHQRADESGKSIHSGGSAAASIPEAPSGPDLGTAQVTFREESDLPGVAPASTIGALPSAGLWTKAMQDGPPVAPRRAARLGQAPSVLEREDAALASDASAPSQPAPPAATAAGTGPALTEDPEDRVVIDGELEFLDCEDPATVQRSAPETCTI